MPACSPKDRIRWSDRPPIDQLRARRSSGGHIASRRRSRAGCLQVVVTGHAPCRLRRHVPLVSATLARPRRPRDVSWSNLPGSDAFIWPGSRGNPVSHLHVPTAPSIREPCRSRVRCDWRRGPVMNPRWCFLPGIRLAARVEEPSPCHALPDRSAGPIRCPVANSSGPGHPRSCSDRPPSPGLRSRRKRRQARCPRATSAHGSS